MTHEEHIAGLRDLLADLEEQRQRDDAQWREAWNDMLAAKDKEIADLAGQVDRLSRMLAHANGERLDNE